MTYRLADKFTSYRNRITVVGCGGTGGFVAEGICRLILGQPGKRLVLVDYDRVEERNLGRQNFTREDLGLFKARALAQRLARKYGLPVGYSLGPFGARSSLRDCALVVGCVDNPLARAAIAEAVDPGLWWIDAGNGRDFGQVLVGNAPLERLGGAFDEEAGLCYALPLPTLVRPELLAPEPPRGDCAEAVETREQSPTINQMVAALVVDMVGKILEGRLAWWQAYLDLESGSLHTISPTPEAVSRLTVIRASSLIARKGERQ